MTTIRPITTIPTVTPSPIPTPSAIPTVAGDLPHGAEPDAVGTRLAYHRLAHRARPLRWWRPLLVLVLAPVIYLVVMAVLLVAAMVIEGVVPAWRPAVDAAMELASLNHPASLAALMLMIAVMLPAALLAVAAVGRRPVGTLISVAGRVRWLLLGRAAAITLVILVAFQGAAVLLGPSGPTPPVDPSRLLPMLIIVVLVVPWQAAAEEVVFRGLLMQTVGAWLRHPAWAILLPLPLFVIGHDYNAVGLVDVAVFAAVAGYLSWRTGGLEAAIGMHVVNNVGALIIGVLTGTDLDATEITPLATALSVSYTLITAAVILAWHRRTERRAT